MLVGALTVASLGAVPTFGVRDMPPKIPLLWNADEAYLFVEQSRAGWRLNYFMRMVNLVAPSGVGHNVIRRPLEVFRITIDRVERHHFNHQVMFELMGVDGHVTTLRERWTGERFEPEPTLPAFPASFASGVPSEFTDVNGWSKRTLSVPIDGDRTTEFVIGGQSFQILASSRGPIESQKMSLTLIRADQSSAALWSGDTFAHSLSRSEYERLFGN